MCIIVLTLRQKLLGEKHPDTNSSMASLVATGHAQGRYNKAVASYVEDSVVRRSLLIGKHAHTIKSIADLANIHSTRRHSQYIVTNSIARDGRLNFAGQSSTIAFTEIGMLSRPRVRNEDA
jgi:hypothetical protein